MAGGEVAVRMEVHDQALARVEDLDSSAGSAPYLAT